MTNQQESPRSIFRGNHPSGLTDEGELAYVSADFWALEAKEGASGRGIWERLLSFQQGWKACKDFHELK